MTWNEKWFKVSADETVDTLRISFSINGLPDTILFYNPASLAVYEFREFICKQWNLSFDSPKTDQGNEL